MHGTKQLVRMATSRSLGLAMMRQPVTPQALQPEAHGHGEALPPAGARRPEAPIHAEGHFWADIRRPPAWREQGERRWPWEAASLPLTHATVRPGCRPPPAPCTHHHGAPASRAWQWFLQRRQPPRQQPEGISYVYGQVEHQPQQQKASPESPVSREVSSPAADPGRGGPAAPDALPDSSASATSPTPSGCPVACPGGAPAVALRHRTVPSVGGVSLTAKATARRRDIPLPLQSQRRLHRRDVGQLPAVLQLAPGGTPPPPDAAAPPSPLSAGGGGHGPSAVPQAPV